MKTSKTEAVCQRTRNQWKPGQKSQSENPFGAVN